METRHCTKIEVISSPVAVNISFLFISSSKGENERYKEKFLRWNFKRAESLEGNCQKKKIKKLTKMRPKTFSKGLFPAEKMFTR